MQVITRDSITLKQKVAKVSNFTEAKKIIIKNTTELSSRDWYGYEDGTKYSVGDVIENSKISGRFSYNARLWELDKNNKQTDKEIIIK